ncbi:probable metalloreductase Aim14p [Monosporozyma servazzii]
MIEKELYPRHGGSSHYANIPSGYYLLVSCLLFVALVLVVKKFVPQRGNQRGFKWIYELNPIFLSVYFTSTVIILMSTLFITSHDHYYNIFTKRLGRISYGFTNLIILIMLQEPLSVFNGMVSYLEFIPLHKWLSRGVIGMSLMHGVLFAVKWHRDPDVKLWDKMVVNRANFVGVVISMLFCFMLIISVKQMRHKWYRLFYLSHQLINLCFVVLIPFHARPTVTFPFLTINVLLMVVYCLNNTWKARRVSVIEKIETYENRFVIVTIPCTCDGFVSPGSHVRVSPYARYDLRYWLLPSHPYTVATYSTGEVKLIIKKTRFRIDETQTYTICGPIANASIDRLVQGGGRLGHVILVAGGSGISFILPIYCYLLNNNNTAAATTEGMISFKRLKIIWLVKDIVEYEFIRDKVGLPEELFANMDIYITVSVAEGGVVDDNSNDEEDIELQNFIPMRGLSSDKDTIPHDKDTIETDRIKYGRIDWDLDLQELCDDVGDSNFVPEGENDNNDNNGNYIIGCGPQSLIEDCGKFGLKNGYKVITEYYSI